MNWLLQTRSADGKVVWRCRARGKEEGTVCMLKKIRMDKHLDGVLGAMPGSEGQLRLHLQEAFQGSFRGFSHTLQGARQGEGDRLRAEKDQDGQAPGRLPADLHTRDQHPTELPPPQYRGGPSSLGLANI